MESLGNLDIRDTFNNSVYTEEDMTEGAPEMVLDSPPPVHPGSSQSQKQHGQQQEGKRPPATTTAAPAHPHPHRALRDGFSEDFDNLSPDYLPPTPPPTTSSDPPNWQAPPPD